MFRRSASILLAASVAFACSAKKDERPSIVLISIDSLRPDHLGCYGYAKPTSPAIDAVAAEGVRFETAVSTSSWTLPAHAGMFTGLFDSTHGLVDNGLTLGKGHLTLAESLRQAGYRTVGFYGGPYLHPTFGLNRGFETYQSCMTKLADDMSDVDVRVAAEVRNGATHEDITGPRTIDEVRKWCARGDDGRPFFAFVHLWDVHYDYNPPKPYAEMFDPGYTGTLTGKAYMENTAITAPLMKENPRDFQHLLALYDGEIRFTDDNLKTILALLEARAGGKERMCLVITADHGEGFFEHGIKGHHQALWDELIKVPLVVRFPGSIAPGRLIHEQVRTVDLFPTLAKIGHAAIPSYLPGRDLVALAQATTPITGEPTLVELLNRGADLQILRTSTIKVRRMKLSKEYRGFLLDRDPGEITPVDQRNPDIAAAGAELEKWLHDVSALRTKLAADPQKIEVDPKLENRLRSLGYTEGK